jgi:transglutaminase-like putative cysteine protease
MERRDFLRSAGLATAGVLAGRARLLRAEPAATADGWRTFELVTRIEVLKPSGPTRIWMPTPLPVVTPFQRTLPNGYDAPGGAVRLVSDKDPDALAMAMAEFPAGARPVLTVTSRASTRNFTVDLAGPAAAAAQAPDRKALAHFTRPTRLLPTDGIVKATALQATRGARTDEEKARAIYGWIVENTFRDAKVRGCGVGDIRSMLETKNLGGKCADLNALYVGLARAAGLPARDVYGIRTARSELGYKSLGASSATITKSQHCRAEVYIAGRGWVPVDPADVRKVALEEPPGNRPLDDDMVARARARLFGSWEMNWVAYNFAHDVVLPGSKQGPVGFLMYPQAETDQGRLDSLDPDNFKYEITSQEIAVPLALS